jgi:hypothetical protein
VRWSCREALIAYAELWHKDQATPLQGSDVNALATLLLCIDDELPAFAVEAVARLGPQAADAAPHLVTLAQSSGDPKLVARALVALKNTGVRTDLALNVLVKLLDHPDVGVKDSAALALFQLGPERFDDSRLANLMGWLNAAIRTEAEKLLRQRLAVITAADLSALRQGLKHPVREVRLVYIDAIGSLQAGGRDAAADLFPFLISTDKAISEQAIRALDKMGLLVDLARDQADPAVLAATLGALRGKGLKSTEALTIYEKNLNHANDGVKNAAALALVELAPEKVSKDRLIEFMSRPDPLNLAATLALHKAEPKNAVLKTKGVPILVRNLAPDINDIKGFVAQPLRSKPAATLLDIGGASAVVPVVQHLLSNNNPIKLTQNHKTEPTAARLMGYELLREFAKRATAKQDRELIAALKKQDISVSGFWVAQETKLANQPNQTPEMRQLRTATLEAADKASAALKALR